MLSRSLARSLAGKLGGGLASASAADVDAILLALGSDLLHWWEPRESEVTLNSSNISAIANLVSGGPSMLQATASAQPAWVNDGSGPNGQPFVRLQDIARRIGATIPTLTGPHFTGVYVVQARVSAAQPDRNSFRLDEIASGTIRVGWIHNTLSGYFRHYGGFSSGVEDLNPITSPTYSTTWQLTAARVLDGSAALSQIDGTTTTPSWASTSGFGTADRVTIGRPVGADSCGGDVACVILTTEATSAVDEIVKSYVTARFGLTLS